MRIAALLVAALLAGVLTEVGRGVSNGVEPTAEPPNLLMIYVDDEPARYRKALTYVDSMKATDFGSAIINNPRCCPSRATLLTGKYSQHTGVENNYEAQNLDDTNTLATWLDPTYDTALVGKYLNDWEKIGGPSYIPPGWDHWFAHYGRFDHYDYSVSDNGTSEHFGTEPQDYGTDVYGKQALDFISSADPPFFLYFTPLAPHTPFTPGPDHLQDFSNWKPKLPPNFNRTDKGAARFYRVRHKTTRRLERKRIVAINRMLRSIDSYVEQMVDLLREQGELDNTYIVFMSDNGLSLGSHRWWRKGCPYEECVRVPLRISGPGIPDAEYGEVPVSNIDIAPTFAELAGVTPPAGTEVDGKSLVPLLQGDPGSLRTRAILIHAKEEKNQGPAFWGVRTIRWKYIESHDGSRELYDLRADRFELHNLAGEKRYSEVQAKLADRLDELKQ
jgi:N-acetylglucosamine-6-sulfatase